MTDPTHPDGDTKQQPFALQAVEDVFRVLLRHRILTGDYDADLRLCTEVAAAVAVPPAAGPDDGLRALDVDGLIACWINAGMPDDIENDREAAERFHAELLRCYPAALATVPSAGLPTPPEADGPSVRRDERGQMWVDGHMYDAEPEQADDMRREARELVAVAAFLDAETVAADVAEGGAR